jgi:hypothetical protein
MRLRNGGRRGSGRAKSRGRECFGRVRPVRRLIHLIVNRPPAAVEVGRARTAQQPSAAEAEHRRPRPPADKRVVGVRYRRGPSLVGGERSSASLDEVDAVAVVRCPAKQARARVSLARAVDVAVGGAAGVAKSGRGLKPVAARMPAGAPATGASIVVQASSATRPRRRDDPVRTQQRVAAEGGLLSCPRHGAWRSLVSALVWGTRGPRFKSGRPDSNRLTGVAHKWPKRHDRERRDENDLCCVSARRRFS